MKLLHKLTSALLPLAATTLVAGCASTGAPLPPSLELPKPVSDLRAVRKGEKVYFAWTVPTETTDRQTVRHLGPTRICRSPQSALTECGTPVGEVEPQPTAATPPSGSGSPAQKITASYADAIPPDLSRRAPTAFLTYAVEVLNTSHRGAGLSNQVQIPVAPVLPPPDDFKAQLTADGVTLTWTGVLHEHEIAEMRHLYRVYRRQEGANADTMVGEVSLSTSVEGQLIDHSFEWQKTYFYRVTVVTVIPQPGKPDIQVEGEDTPEIRIFADDVFPPSVPSGLQAVFSGVGQPPFVDLIWAPSTEADLAGYNVYRREADGQPMRLNSESLKTPAYRDANVQSGHNYVYSVTAVDQRGNESAMSEETSEQVP
jgi:hypothetical protein